MKNDALSALMAIGMIVIPPIVVAHELTGWPTTPEGATTYHVDHGTTPPVLLARANHTATTLLIGADAAARATLTPEELVTRRGFDHATATGAAILATVEAQNGLTWIDPIVSRNRSFNVGTELTNLIAAGYIVGHEAAQDPDELQQLLDAHTATMTTLIDELTAQRDAAQDALEAMTIERDDLAQQVTELQQWQANVVTIVRAALEIIEQHAQQRVNNGG